MTATVVALAWGALCAGWLARLRPAGAARAFALSRSAASARGTADALARVVATAMPSPRRAVAVFALALGFGALFPPAGLAVLIAACARPLRARRRTQAVLEVTVERDVADVVALVALAVRAGCNLPGALDAASRHADGPLADALRGAVTSAGRGTRLADALEALPDQLGEATRPFIAALVSCDRYGAALGPTLDRLAIEVRTSSRQRAEAAARRLPVRLLFPLITCILPAFALLTVAPLIAGSFNGLGL
ncbi:MAG TPA: type II secretion system F family protein [Acidimicrobiales bacterium]|nr:type II secretion system F family protein [Acidimicrobiales bacterium]